MNLFNKIKVRKKIITPIFFFLYFFIGVTVYDDYGIYWDEQASRNYGFVSGDFIIEKFLPNKIYTKIYDKITTNKFKDQIKKKNPPKLTDNNYLDRAYGVTFELPSAAIETILNLKHTNDIYKLRHFLVFLIFFFTTICFYKLSFLISNDNLISLLFTSLLILHPRIFAESFYNSKDLIFLCYVTISIYFGFKLLKKINLKRIILFSIFVGLSFGLKIIGILPLYFFFTIYLITNKLSLKIKLKNLSVIVLTSLMFCFIFWPYLWNNPILNFKSAFELFSNYTWYSDIPFMGIYTNSSELPWFYIPLFFFVTTPPFILSIIILGIVLLICQLLYIRKNKIYFNSTITFFFIIQIFLIPLLFAIIKNSTLYDGWRHFFFMYPILIIASLISINNFLKIKILRLFLIFIIFAGNIFQLYWNYNNHPLQHSYFNKLLFKNPNELFVSDYWGISNKQLIEKVLKKEKSEKIYYKFEASNFRLSLDIFTDSEKRRFMEYSNQENVKYYYLFILKRFKNFNSKIFEKLGNENEIIHEIIINKSIINGVYKIKL